MSHKRAATISNTARKLHQEACRILHQPRTLTAAATSAGSMKTLAEDPYTAAFMISAFGFLEYYEGRFRIAAQRFKEAEERF